MRMFLIGMCDIFLILYLTAIANVQPQTILTVDDFYELKAMHAALEADKLKTEDELKNILESAQEEKARLEARLAEEKSKLKKTEETLSLSDTVREQINKDLQEKERMLKEREQLLAQLNKDIELKEDARRRMEIVYQRELEDTTKVIEITQKRAKALEVEARNAQRLANQMKEEADLAYQTADVAKEVQVKAVQLKEAALAARQKAEQEREKALKAMEAAQADQEIAEKNVQKLEAVVEDIKQEGDTAYNKNVRPQLQKINVSYERAVINDIKEYERELTLLPVEIDGKVYVVFPSRQIGFTARSDKAPDALVVMYQNKKVKKGWINKDDDLIAILIADYKGKVDEPYPADTQLAQLMPALLSLRNNGNVGFSDKIRGLSDSYFIVNRDYLKSEKDKSLKYMVTGFRGTGTRGERIVRGDQLVDLNGRLIGIANDDNSIIRVTTLSGWDTISF